MQARPHPEPTQGHPLPAEEVPPQCSQLQPSRPTSGRAFSIAIANAVIVSMTDPDPL